MQKLQKSQKTIACNALNALKGKGRTRSFSHEPSHRFPRFVTSIEPSAKHLHAAAQGSTHGAVVAELSAQAASSAVAARNVVWDGGGICPGNQGISNGPAHSQQGVEAPGTLASSVNMGPPFQGTKHDSLVNYLVTPRLYDDTKRSFHRD